MQRCLQLAQKGLGKTYPNPLVGCVIILDGKIIGEGWHQKAGEAHAEVNAIHTVKDKTSLSKATLYVNLEPCNHHGKTPPCVDLLIKHQIKRVVVGSVDPNPLVAGKGIHRLRKSGCEVTTHILLEECDSLNKRFFTFHRKKRPYILLKWAESKEGFIAPPKNEQQRNVFWLSDSFSQQRVHQWRSEEQAIMVGINTVKADNPTLNVRKWTGNNPIPVILDPQAKLNESDQLYKIKRSLHITTSEVAISEIGNLFDSSRLLEYLYQKNIQSVLIEGGAYTLQHFLDNDCWDEIKLLKTNSELKKGIKAPHIDRIPSKVIPLAADELWHFSKVDSKLQTTL